MARTAGDCVLYRHFDEEGTLLYVGVSNSVFARISAHQKGSDWFGAIAVITLDRYPDRDTLLRAEAEAIRNEAPLFNKAHALLSKTRGADWLREWRASQRPPAPKKSEAAPVPETPVAPPAPLPAGPDALLSSRLVAKRLGVSMVTLSRWRSARLGPPFVRLSSRQVAYPIGKLETWVREHTEVALPQRR